MFSWCLISWCFLDHQVQLHPSRESVAQHTRWPNLLHDQQGGRRASSELKQVSQTTYSKGQHPLGTPQLSHFLSFDCHPPNHILTLFLSHFGAFQRGLLNSGWCKVRPHWLNLFRTCDFQRSKAPPVFDASSRRKQPY